MLTLRLSESAAAGGARRVAVVLEGAGVRQTADSAFRFEWSARDREDLRWYLEDFLEWPLDPAPTIAAGVEKRMAELGTELFEHVFASEDGRDLWATLRGRLAETRIEIETTVSGAGAAPWELLRDRKTDEPLALHAASFVRADHRPARAYRLPAADGEELRVLLVICRPAGRDDVPFRSVAAHLLRYSEDAPRAFALDVLRPPTFARLAEVLRRARDEGRPYHVVHFDGHGTYADVAAGGGSLPSPLRYGPNLASPPRPGEHGYLLFEDAADVDNEQWVDGPALGALLAEAGVPVLVLNACRSAYAETPAEPADDENDENTDVHGRVRAFGSLALEVAHAGVPGVVAMRYNVYVVTAARFIAELYGALLSGQSLGAAVKAARAQLAADPKRAIAFEPRTLRDWCVPVVHEAAPLTLFTPSRGRRPVIRLDAAAQGDDHADLPRRPDAGFFGRDETLLALDRALDTQSIVLLHAFAGAGKTSTATEFARWYQRTGGLRDGTVFFSSFERHLPLARLLDRVGDAFGEALESQNVHWLTLDDRTRRQIAVQVLRQVPVLWVWDNVEPVAGFPAGTPSAWSDVEQADLRDFLRDLAGGRTRVLLTSRGTENAWLGGIPARIRLPVMPMRERVQLTQALAARHGHRVTDVDDWRPLLRYTDGNPLTITVLVGQVLRDGLTSKKQIVEFVDRLRAGEIGVEDDAREGRGRSLAASLSYGFARAFTDAERARLAVLHLFQQTVDVVALAAMGANMSEFAGLTRESGTALLDRAADVGLLTPLGGGSYGVHPALPWYFADLFAGVYGTPDRAGARQATWAYVEAIAALGDYYHHHYGQGRHEVVGLLGAEEGNLRHALALARGHGWWPQAVGCMQGLRALYVPTGRGLEWARLVEDLTPHLVDPATGGPVPGREQLWSLLTDYRVGLAIEGMDWQGAERLLRAQVAWKRERTGATLAADPTRLDDARRGTLRDLAAGLQQLGVVLYEQGRAECTVVLREAIELCRCIDARREEAMATHTLGNAYFAASGFRDLGEAEHWYRRALELTDEHDRPGRARAVGQLGYVAYERFHQAQEAGQSTDVCLAHLNTALKHYTQALALTPQDAITDQGPLHHQLGNIYEVAGEPDIALRHFRQFLALAEQAGDRYGAGQSRHSIAHTLAIAGRFPEARLYAHAALRDYEACGPAGPVGNIEQTRRLLADIDAADH